MQKKSNEPNLELETPEAKQSKKKYTGFTIKDLDGKNLNLKKAKPNLVIYEKKAEMALV